VTQVIAAAATCLGDAPPELAQDIMFQGVHLTGGGALLRGVTQRLADATAVPVHLVDAPLECVVQGAGCASSRSTAQAPLHRRRLIPSRLRRRRQTAWGGGDVVSTREQLVGRLADLPVPVVGRPAQGRFDPGVVEAGQGDRGPAPHGGLVVQRGDDGGRPSGSPMAPSAATAASRHRTSSWARAVAASAGRRRPPGVRPGTRPRRPRPAGRGRRGRFDQGVERGARAAAAHRQRGVGGPPPYRARPAGQGAGDVGHRERAEAGQRAERSRLHVGVGVGAPGAPASPRPECPAAIIWRRRSAAARRSCPGSMAGSSLTESSMADMDTTAAGEAAAIPSPAGVAAPGASVAALAHRPSSVSSLIVAAVVILSRWNVNYYASPRGTPRRWRRS
jgi:hypothetical protein